MEKFKKNRQAMIDIVTRIIRAHRADGDREEVPFIDSMLQNYSSDDKVSMHLRVHLKSIVSPVCGVCTD